MTEKPKSPYKVLRGRIIQIIPAGNLLAFYRDEDGTFTKQVDVLALDEWGQIAGMLMNGHGEFEEITYTRGFCTVGKKVK